jgi:hypothetical protein
MRQMVADGGGDSVRVMLGVAVRLTCPVPERHGTIPSNTLRDSATEAHL